MEEGGWSTRGCGEDGVEVREVMGRKCEGGWREEGVEVEVEGG